MRIGSVTLRNRLRFLFSEGYRATFILEMKHKAWMAGIDQGQERADKLEAAIRAAVTQKLDDLCWLDVMRDLAGLVGVEFNPEMLPKEVFLKNCERFHASLIESDGYERKLVLIARGHPEADGGVAHAGQTAFTLRFPLERDWELELKIGEDECRAFRAMVKQYGIDELEEEEVEVETRTM